MIDRTHRTPSRTSTRVAVSAIALLGFGLMACSGESGTIGGGSLLDGTGGDEPAAEEPAEPVEPAEPAEPETPDEPPAEPEPEAPETPDTPDDGGGDDGSSTNWLPIVLVGALVVAAGAGIAGMMSSRSKQSRARTATDGARQQDVAHIVSSGYWVRDQASTVMQITDANQLNSAWGQMRNQMLNVERDVVSLSARPELAQLTVPTSQVSASLAGLRTALESYVTIAAGEQPDPIVKEQAAQTVISRQRQLDTAITDLNNQSIAS